MNPSTSTNNLLDRLPEGLGAKVEATVGAKIVAVTPRGGGGASREGAEATLRYPDGRELRAYMTHDTRKVGAGDDAAFLREAAILRALSGPLRDKGIAAAKFVAAIPECRALIMEFVSGQADFNKLKTPEDRRATVHDYMRQLAALHALDVEKMPVEGMGEIQRPSVTVRETIHWLRARDMEQEPDPLVQLILDWLERNIPKDPERTVIVHGDAGPANFLFENNRVTAMLDWELVHYGDPMADLAMICLRNLFQPFIPLPDAFAAYEAAGGAKVDLDRIRYYRLYFQARFGGNMAQFNDPTKPAPAAFGLRLMTSTIHRHVMSEAVAALAGVKLAPVELPECPLGAHHRSFEIALADLQDTIVPCLIDEQASSKAKGLARLVKWWRDIERYGSAFEQMELAELSRALSQSLGSPAEGRRALCDAIRSHSIDDRTAMQLCYAMTTRDRALLANAMGSLAKSRFAPLS